jgi:aminomethyltransferase
LSAELLQTPLYTWHVRHGARLVPFAGWAMPVQYPSGILAEHRAVRAGVGLFDISHMGRIEVAGADAGRLLQQTTTNDVAALPPGRGQYSLLCNEAGGTLDDLVVYRLETYYLVVVNAVNRERDIAWWQRHAAAAGLAVQLTDRTFEVAMIAVQGPASEALLQPLTSLALDTVRYYAIARAAICGREGWLARTGYTGEDGFELLVPSEHAVALWEALLARTAPVQPLPAGLGARDTLRLEAGYPLYGHELTEEITPLEAGLERFVKLDKGPFVGQAALAAQRAAGVPRRLVGFEMVNGAVPRQGYPLVVDGQPVGVVTSGSYGPSVGRAIGMGYVPPALARDGQALGVVIRGGVVPARVRPLPFWPHRTRRGPAPRASG